MQANLTQFIPVGLVAGALFTVSMVHAADSATTTDKDAFPVFDNYITVSGQAVGVTGDKSAFQARNWTSKGGSGGIEDFQYAHDITKGVAAKADGHALGGAEDYLAHVNVTKDEFGSFDAGYKRFRTFYDGVGGFFPANDAWMPLAKQDLHVDRAKFWAQGQINLPDKPVVTLRYTNDLRDGRKDTTIWGDTDQTGIPISSNTTLNTVSADRKIVPAYLQLGERQQTLEATVTQTVGNTKYEFSLVGNRIENLDTRYINRYPGEVKPFPAIPSSPATSVPATSANNAVYGFDQEGVKANTLGAAGKVETIINDKVTVHGGLSYQHATSDITGYRPLYVDITTTPFGAQGYLGGLTSGGRAPGSYQNLTGGLKEKILTANVGAEIKPFKDLYVEPALKAEEVFTQGNDSFTYLSNTVNQTTGAITSAPLPYAGASRVKETSWTPEINTRYTGFKNLALYGTADYRYAPGDQNDTYTTTSVSTRSDNVKENHGHYVLGANWTPYSFFSLRGEMFYKDHQNSFYGYGANLGNEYVLGYRLYGYKLTAIASPLPTLTFTTRYILQAGQMDLTVATGNGATLYPQYDTMDSRSHQIGETIDWNPLKQLYVQANFNVVFDTLSTVYPRAGGLANDVVHNSDNNYWEASLLAGYALDKATNLEAQYTYYRADNYEAGLAATTAEGLPYGAGEKEYAINLGVKRKITDHLIASAKIGYFSSTNDTTGGFTNYSARLAYISLEHSF